jgi:hypothetical protein
MEAVLAMSSTWNPSTPLRIITISSNSSLVTRRPFSLVCREKWRESKVAGNKKKMAGKKGNKKMATNKKGNR